jgi:hypothetical protein
MPPRKTTDQLARGRKNRAIITVIVPLSKQTNSLNSITYGIARRMSPLLGNTL